MSIWKRLDNELKSWPNEMEKPTLDKQKMRLHFSYGDIALPPTYPFRAPHIVKRFIPRSPIRPDVWLLAIAAHAECKKLFPTPAINCVCCASFTCEHNWTVQCRCSTVAAELLFCTRYRAMLDVCLPKTLPVELIEAIAAFLF